MANHRATQKVWIAEDGKTLVPDGHLKASILFARRGQTIPPSAIKPFSNAHEFFDGILAPSAIQPPTIQGKDSSRKKNQIELEDE